MPALDRALNEFWDIILTGRDSLAQAIRVSHELSAYYGVTSHMLMVSYTETLGWKD